MWQKNWPCCYHQVQMELLRHQLSSWVGGWDEARAKPHLFSNCSHIQIAKCCSGAAAQHHFCYSWQRLHTKCVSIMWISLQNITYSFNITYSSNIIYSSKVQPHASYLPIWTDRLFINICVSSVHWINVSWWYFDCSTLQLAYKQQIYFLQYNT